MPVIKALIRDELSTKVIETIQRHCALAFAVDCRVAMRWRFSDPPALTVEYEFRILSPGELPPTDKGWEIFRSEEHTSELHSLMRNSYHVFCLTKKQQIK